MLKMFLSSAGIAFQNLRANLFHTLLSTLGIVIGVAALVSILALGDGMEQYGRKQVSTTTSLQSILVSPVTGNRIDGVWIENEQVSVLTPAHLAEIRKTLPQPATFFLKTATNGMITLEDTIKRPAQVNGIAGDVPTASIRLAHGTLFGEKPDGTPDSVIILSDLLAKRLTHDGQQPKDLLGKQVRFQNLTLRVTGILAPENEENLSHAIIPLALFDEATLQKEPPKLMVTAGTVEDVTALKSGLGDYLNAHVKGGKAGFDIITNEMRLKQLAEAILLFKVVMGFITGIAILVGGIGVMNVLLMSVTERTREIGIRKATGATRSDIASQFLAEALAISLTGSFVGFVVGMAMTLGITPIVRSFTKIPFYAAFDYRSFLVVMVVAILTGIVFGVYPAKKAARLTPVEAIRYE